MFKPKYVTSLFKELHWSLSSLALSITCLESEICNNYFNSMVEPINANMRTQEIEIELFFLLQKRTKKKKEIPFHLPQNL